ncbi:MAG: hypothetical protein R3B09_20560 [Nannocystaceae bacterium]
MRTLPALSLLLVLPTLACNGDDTTATESATDSATGATMTASATAATTMSSATGTATDATATGTGTATGTSTTTGPTTETDPTTSTATTATTDSTTTNPTTTDSTTDPTDSTTTGVSTEPTTDPTTTTTTGDPPPVCGNGVVEEGEACDDGDDIDKNSCSNTCALVPCDQQEGGGMGGFDYSYIWIANSPQGTVSKVDTVMLKEVARYNTDPVQNSSPSRTAVNVDGRYAAVANRIAGSVTVFASDVKDCVDKNNNGMIETSTGPNDVKPWGQDECMLWNVKISPSNNSVEQKGPRPLGWDFDDQDPVTCEYKTHTLWMGWYGATNNAYFWHLDAQGNKLGEVIVPVWGSQNSWGPYGGAVDKNHDFWVAGWHGPLVRVNHADYTYKMWNDPILNSTSSYGMALDKEGDPWFGGCGGSIVTFNTQNETFKVVGSPGGCMRGLMVDGEGRGWIAKNGGACLVEVDTVNDTIVNQNINIPGCQTVVGVSIDIEGYVWIVDQGGRAYKMDPDTYQVQTVMGFNGPYTYSDMTGAGIRLQAMPQ